MLIFGSAAYNSGQLTVEIPKGTYRSIVVNFTGTNAGGTAVALTELGRLRISRSGKDICNLDLSQLSVINNADSGVAQFTSTGSGAITFQARYNFYLNEDKNNVLKFEQSEGIIQLSFNATGAALMSAGTWSVYLVKSKGFEKYVPKAFDFSQNLGASGTTITPILNDKNVYRILFYNGSAFNNILISKDSYVLVNSSGSALLYDTGYIYRLETAPTFILKDFNPSHEIAEMLSGQIQLNLTSGTTAGNQSIAYQCVEYAQDRLVKTVNSYDSFVATKLASNPQAVGVVKVLSSPKLAQTISTVETL